MAVPMTAELQALNARLGKNNMRGQWMAEIEMENATAGHGAGVVPFGWKWQAFKDFLAEACEALPETMTARRHVAGTNPGLPIGLTRTIAGGVQLVRPGEHAWAHRHSISALRFVISGAEKMRTVVDGESYPMLDYDLILTPAWSWHDHINSSAKDAYWLDVLDVNVLLSLDLNFYEPYGEEGQPEFASAGEMMSQRTGMMRPAWERPQRGSPPVRYPWAEVERQLKAMAEVPGSPYDGIALEYVNPLTGGPTMKTLDCWMQMLRPGEVTKSHRHTSSAMYFVVRGNGRTVIDGQAFEWGPHDVIALPNWLWHHHENLSKDADAVLFSVNDSPLIEAIGQYREEPENTLRTQPPPPVPGEIVRAGRGFVRPA